MRAPATRVLHAVARIALRFASPIEAARLVRSLARALPTVRTPDDARFLQATLGARGTCLSRALTVAARVENARVAIGVDPSDKAAFAHAWVVCSGIPLRDGDPKGTFMVEL